MTFLKLRNHIIVAQLECDRAIGRSTGQPNFLSANNSRRDKSSRFSIGASGFGECQAV